ncbi:MAG TPA: creatininase family protein [Armatimonadota bacterium]|jgi:creatinine amidohydrolase
MKWMELTSPELRQAVETCQGVCVVPFGCLEKHGDHLPLGTDVYHAEAVVARAAEMEPVVEFPTQYFTQIEEGKHWPGAFCAGSRLMYDVLERVCGEIARNGFQKIVFFNGHGGNGYFLPHFSYMRLERRYPYTLFLYRNGSPAIAEVAGWDAIKETEHDGHAGELETSVMLALRPDLVHMDLPNKDSGPATGRLQHLKDMRTGFNWYADNPKHHQGDGATATVEKGRFLLDGCAQRFAEALKILKEDTVAPQVLEEFYQQSGL